MSNQKVALSHDEWEIEALKADPEMAVLYLKEAMTLLSGGQQDRGAGLLAIRSIAQAYGGLAKISQDAGISREALYRAFSPKGNPTLNTLLAVLGSVGMRLSVEPVKA